ncbi:MAG: DUF4339 domain-containing protein [Armatimonadetes bacterium]|nr:DUF4339 domain-containing protein [Armatimonadota bacterium]
MQPTESAYYVIGDDGNKYGPADLNDLSAWAREGRIHPHTWLESAITHQRLTAGQVPGLFAAYHTGQQAFQPQNYTAQNQALTAFLLGGFSLFACCAPFGIYLSIVVAGIGFYLGAKSGRAGNMAGSVGAVFCGLVIALDLTILVVGFNLLQYVNGLR